MAPCRQAGISSVHVMQDWSASKLGEDFQLNSGTPAHAAAAHKSCPRAACLPTTPLLLFLPQIMERGPKVAMLPVVDDGKVQGLVTLHGLVSAGL